jgi:hypothetical protein
MAERTFDVNAYGAEVRVRSPSMVVLLHAVTLGIYNWFWYYKINRELRDFGKVYRLERLENTKPWLSVLAVTLGILLIVPPFISWYRCTKRVQDAQAVLNRPPLSGWAIVASYVGGFFFYFPLLLIPYLVQDALNGVFEPFEGLDPLAGHDAQQTPISVGALEMLPIAREWSLGGLTDEDFNAITHFLLRRERLDGSTRVKLAEELATRIRPHVPDADRSLEPERFLELIAAARGGPGLPSQVS